MAELPEYRCSIFGWDVSASDVQRANEILHDIEANAVMTSVELSHLKQAQQVAQFPEASPILDELGELDITTMTPLEAINKLYEWKKKFG